MYDVESVTVRLGDRDLLRDVTWRLGPGDRVGVVGVNGAGKTTLLRLLAGEVTPTAGHVRVGRTVRPGYLSQTVAELPTSSPRWPRSRTYGPSSSSTAVASSPRGRWRNGSG